MAFHACFEMLVVLTRAFKSHTNSIPMEANDIGTKCGTDYQNLCHKEPKSHCKSCCPLTAAWESSKSMNLSIDNALKLKTGRSQ